MARREATRTAIGEFLGELGRRFSGRGTLYLAGGSAMVYQGYRPRTQDIDYRIELTTGDDGQFIIDDVRALVRSGTLTVAQIVAGFEEIAPRIDREALPRVREDDFRRKIEAVARLLQQ